MTVYDGIILTFILIGIITILVSFLYAKYDTYNTLQEEEKKQLSEDKRIDYDEVNAKIIELNEYGEFLKEELDKKHKELLFMYQMIMDKQKEMGIVKDKKLVMDGVSNVEKVYNKNNRHNEETQEITREAENSTNMNKQIIDMTLAGYSQQEIAKKLGIGVGQVQLVLNLYK